MKRFCVARLLILCLPFVVVHSYAAEKKLSPRLTHKMTTSPQLKSDMRRTKLLKEYQHWKGTRYRYGGNSHKAIDCSALTKRIYKNTFAIELPRTASKQLQTGKRVRKKSLTSGDLVFFSTSPGQKHVGIYIGDNLFIHASRRKGVTISTLTNPYWDKRFISGRQLLPEA